MYQRLFICTFASRKGAENGLDKLKMEEGGDARWLMLEKSKIRGWNLVELIKVG